MSRSGFTDSEKALMQLSREVLEGLHITGKKMVAYTLLFIHLTVKSFTHVTNYLLSLPEMKGHYLLSEKFSQDPIENYFGQQRMHGGKCENPTVDSMIMAAQSLRVQGSQAMLPVRGNSSRKRRLVLDEVIDDTPLPKKA